MDESIYSIKKKLFLTQKVKATKIISTTILRCMKITKIQKSSKLQDVMGFKQ